MADGFKGGEGDKKPVDMMDPFQGEMMDPPINACGPCDMNDISWRQLEVNLVRGRYATVFLNVTVSGGNLVIARTGDTPLLAFDKGVKESGDSAGLLPVGQLLTRTETDAYTDGALGTNIASNFRITGMQVIVGQPFLSGVAVGTDNTARQFLPALQFYGPRLVREAFSNTHIKYSYGSAIGGYELGRPEFWTSGMGLLGADLPSNGQPIARLFLPLRLPTWAGGPTDDNAIQVEFNVDHTLTMVADPLVPVPALAPATNYLIPITIMLMGDPRNAKAVTSENVEAMVNAKVAEALGKMNISAAGGGLSIEAMVQAKLAEMLKAKGLG